MTIKLSFIILSWNSEKFLENCFNSIIAKCRDENINYEIILVDNGSKDRSLLIIEDYIKQYPQIFRDVRLSKNHGTTTSRNIAIKKAIGEYICIIDSDTKILGGSIMNVLHMLDGNDDIGIIAPRLLLSNGEIQNSVKKFPTFFQKVSKLPMALFSIEFKNYDFYESFPFDSETSVDSAISACWFFKKDLLKCVGLFDEKIFYSPEDLEYCMRVRNAGKKILYYPFFEILHDTQQISHRSPFSKLSKSHFKGLLYYYKKHGGWFSTKNIYAKIKRN